MKILTVDTETSGFNDPHIVQLACILTENDKELASMNLLIKPEGWEIDPGAEGVHGISLEQAERAGVSIYSALWLFDELCGQSDLIVAHNYAFDSKVIAKEYERLEKVWTPPAFRCTMHATTNICKIPGKRGYKWPRLQEAHVHFFGEEFESAHDALADVRACWRVHKHLIDNNLI